jgi:AcrR family transcriptional regulator
LSRAPQPPRTAQGAETRERLLQTAIELFAERGYSATSIEQICRRTGVVKTALYWHFGNKEGLLAAAIDRVGGDWIDELVRSAYATDDPQERLKLAIVGLRRIVEERPHLLRMLVGVAYECTESSPATRAALRQFFQRAADAIVRATADVVDYPPEGLQGFARLVLALVIAASLRRLIEPELDLDAVFTDMHHTAFLFLVRKLGIGAPGGPDPLPE